MEKNSCAKSYKSSWLKQHVLEDPFIPESPVFNRACVPSICATKESRQAFLSEYGSQARLLELYGKDKLPLYEVTLGTNLCFYAKSHEDIQYLMCMNPLNISLESGISHADMLPRSDVYQGDVFRNLNLIPYGGYDLASTIFWRIQKPGRIVWSDMTQSQDGDIFWRRRIVEAIERGGSVLAVNFSPVGDAKAHVFKIVPMSTLMDLRPFFNSATASSADLGKFWRLVFV